MTFWISKSRKVQRFNFELRTVEKSKSGKVTFWVSKSRKVDQCKDFIMKIEKSKGVACLSLDGLSAFPLVSHCVSFCFLLLDGVSAFPMPCLPCLQLVSHLVYPLVSQLVFLLVFLCWMACPSSQGLVSLVSPACRPACVSFCFPLWRVVSFWILVDALEILNAHF